MKGIRSNLNLCGCAFGAICLSQPSLAQDNGTTAGVGNVTSVGEGQASANVPSANRDHADIIVTAQKREQKLQDVGLTLTALSSDLLATKRIATLADLANAVPGLIYTQSQNNTPVYTLRGVGFFESSLAAYPDVSTYIDQAPLPLPVTSTLTGFDLERVEVLKGPQGTLFGNNATGGAINFIAAKPKDTFGAGATLGYGRFNTVDFEGYVTGPLADTLNVRLATKVTRGDDWQHGYTNDRTSGKSNTTAGRFLADWKPAERLSFSLNVNGWLNRSDPQAPQYYRLTPQNPPGAPGPFGTSVPTDLPIFTYPTAPRTARAADFTESNSPRARNSFWQAALRTDYEATDGIMLTSLSSYLQTRIRENIEYDGTSLSAFDLQNHRGRINSFSQEIRAASTGGGPARWVVGANYEHTTVGDSALNITNDSSSAFINQAALAFFFSHQKMDNYALFGNLEYDVTPELTLKGGVRYTKAKRTAASGNAQPTDVVDPFPLGFNEFFNIIWSSLSSIYPNFTPVPLGDSFAIDNRLNAAGTPLDPSTYGTAGLFNGKLKEDNVSWSVGVNYKAAPDVLLYANVSKGYKAGSFPLVSAATWSQLESIKQESLIDYEVGFKTQFLDRQLTLNGAAFYYDYRDKQLRSNIVDGIFGLLNGLVNVPKSTVKGGEIEATYRPNSSLTINLAATYLDAKVKRYNGIVGAGVDNTTGLRIPIFESYKGARLPFAPKFQAMASFQYTQPVSDNLELFFGMDVSAQSKSYGVLAITPTDKSDYMIPKRALVGANVGFQSPDDRWKVMIWGKNIFDKYYTINSILAYDGIVRYAGRPAEYGITVGYKF